MDFPLGILGFLQITTLPGLVVHKLIRFRGNFLDRVLVVFGLSLISNYCLVFVLAALKIYTRGVFSIFLLGELIALIWLYRDTFRISVDNLLTAARDRVSGASHFLFSKEQGGNEISNLSFVWVIVVLLFAVKGLIWAGNVFRSNLGTVFSTWDAVVSWNRWAMDWAAGQIPMGSHFYPQLIPANWSITYVLLGDTTLQFFAKSIMPLFALAMFIGLFNLAFSFGEYHFFVAAALLGPLLKQFLKEGISNGYVDIAAAFFGFIAIYILIKAQKTTEVDQLDHLLLLGAVFVAGAAVTKQTGVYLALCYPILVLFMIARPSNSSFSGERLKHFAAYFAIIYLIWVSWYAFKELQILAGADRPNVDVLIDLSSNTYGNVGLFQQVLAALSRFDKFLILFLFIALALPWMNRFYRVLTLLMIPYPLLWAWIAGYDTRNLGIFLPIFALLSGYSSDILVHKLFDLTKRGKLLQISTYVPLILIGALLLGSGFLISSQRLQARQVYLQKQIFSPEKNQSLYDLVAAEHAQTKILTNYPMEYLPGLEKYQVRFDFQDDAVFQAHLKNPDIEYLLFSNSITPAIRDYINSKVQDGSYELLWVNTEWKKFTLVKILKR
jgi:hypothetical protein